MKQPTKSKGWATAMNLAVVLGLAAAGNAEASLITGVTATASSELTQLDRLAAHAVDGNIFSNWESSGVAFDHPAPGDEPDDLDPWITFDLQEAKSLGSMTIYNFHEFDAAVKDMLVEVSLDNVTFSAVGTFSLVPGPFVPQAFSLGNAVGQFVRFDILSSHGGTLYPVVDISKNVGYFGLVGLNEVEFDGETYVAPPPGGGTSVPDTGSSAALLGLGVAGLIGVSRRQRRLSLDPA